MKRRLTLRCLGLSWVSLAALVFAAPAAAETICIDPGHGGVDPGGTGNGLQEKNIVLDVSERFRDLLVADTADENGGGSWSVIMTRDTDAAVSLSGRAQYANSKGADRFMSMHSNAFGDPSANGTETFSLSGSGQGAQLRNLVQEEMIAAWKLTNRGNKTANFAVLRETSMPAELHELAFITNNKDAALLADPQRRQSAAVAHLRAIQRHFGLEPYLPGESQGTSVGAVEVEVATERGPLEGARITVDGDEVGATDRDGILKVDDLEPGQHVIGAVADGYWADDDTVTVDADATASVSLTLEEISDVDNREEGDDCEDSDDCEEEGEAPDLSGGCSSTPGGSAPILWALLLACWILNRSRQTRRPRG